MSTFLNRLREHFTDVLHIFRNELVKVVKDEGGDVTDDIKLMLDAKTLLIAEK